MTSFRLGLYIGLVLTAGSIVAGLWLGPPQHLALQAQMPPLVFLVETKDHRQVLIVADVRQGGQVIPEQQCLETNYVEAVRRYAAQHPENEFVDLLQSRVRVFLDNMKRRYLGPLLERWCSQVKVAEPTLIPQVVRSAAYLPPLKH